MYASTLIAELHLWIYKGLPLISDFTIYITYYPNLADTSWILIRSFYVNNVKSQIHVLSHFDNMTMITICPIAPITKLRILFNESFEGQVLKMKEPQRELGLSVYNTT